jgi:phage gp46-like protein
MPDARLHWHNDLDVGGFADLALRASGEIDFGEDLATSVIISLFSDRLAQPSDDLAANQDDRRGWWGDTDLQREHANDLIGSRLWLLNKSDDKTPLLARGFILDALKWMVDDGVASLVEAQCFFLNGKQSQLGAIVTITRRVGERPVNLQFEWAWAGIGAR